MSGPGKSLLDRLSALKGGSSPGVSLDRSSNALDVSLTGIEPAKPASREDALAARLRSLRNTPEREEHPPQPHNAKAAANSHPGQQKTTVTRGKAASSPPASPSFIRQPHTEKAAVAVPPQSSSRSPAPSTTPAPTAAHAETGDDVDPLLHTDDQTLEDLLNDENLLDGSDPQSRWRFDPKAESAKVSALLDELSKASADQKAPSQKDPDGVGERTRDAHSIDDESEGEEMSREVEDLLSQAFDEARLNPQSAEVPDTPALGRSQLSPGHGDQYDPREDHQGDGDGDTGLSLPSVPSTIAVPKADGGGEGGLSLPSVPSGAPQHDAVSDFDSDIAARMAALGGLGSSSDGMGLPSVPTFQPAERAVKRLTSKAGYTDEDADTWCTVCLEDATLQCLGCEDVYCARCWHEMHIGPAAAFDDRTHKAVRFVKPKKDSQRRVMLGAS
ncbi:zinc FYVE domain containing protein [Colletotrichum tofieldiae]|uniref:Zinc FYVE domain containing protein n=1 Tax=Colletotrichum tofieldiae TaxID=708197 RepID=A0A166PKN6_9PEZI|nr:zinc FYVE domain containing protein [Colletotrichum tofieldiae]